MKRFVHIAFAASLLALAPVAPAMAAQGSAPAAATSQCTGYQTEVKVSADDSPATVTVTDTTTGNPIDVVVTITGTTFDVTPVDPAVVLTDASWCVKSSTATNSGSGTSGASTSLNKKGIVQDISYVVLYSVTSEVIAPCNQSTASGGQGTTSTVYELGTKGPTSFQVYYQMYGQPDQMEIFYEGNLIYTTGGYVSGSNTVTVNAPAGTSTKVTVVMTAPEVGTLWNYTIYCPAS